MVVLAFLSGVALGVAAGASIVVEMAVENARNRLRKTLVYLYKRGVLVMDEEKYKQVKKELER